MNIKVFTYPNTFELYANTYVLSDSKGSAVVIDPGKDDKEVVDYINSNNLHLKGVLLTHGHFDHIRGVDLLCADVFMHEKDEPLLKNSHLNCSDRFSRHDVIIKSQTTSIKDKDVLNLLEEPIVVIHTPFHTEGSICFYLKDSGVLFSGDTLFQYSIGRSDFVTSNPSLINSSLEKLMMLPDEVVVYPGHGEMTTIGQERKLNPFVKR